MAALPTLRLRTQVPFPATVSGDGGITVSKTNGEWVIEPDWSVLELEESIADPEARQLWTYEELTGVYRRLSIQALIDNLPEGPPGPEGPEGPPGGGTVTSVDTGTGLTGGPITTTGTVSFASVANNRILGNVSGGSAAPIALTGTQVASVLTNRTRQVFTSGTAQTYTTPANVKYIEITCVGGGGGGAGSGTTPGAAAAGGATTFSGGTMSAGGGGAGTAATGSPAAGGTASGGDINLPGAAGGATTSTANYPGGPGGNSVLGGGGPMGYAVSASTPGAGAAAATNSGSGGGGAGSSTTAGPGGGGGAGAMCNKVITSPAASYTYTVGAGGAAGTAGTTGAAGGAGAAGLIIVDEYYV